MSGAGRARARCQADLFDEALLGEVGREGGGFLATVPELPGCMSDGETLEQAATNIDDAIACWIDTARRLGREVPAPGQSKLVRA